MATVTATGTAQNSSYSYAFPVPQYANAKEAKWVITKATALDDQGDTLSLVRSSARFILGRAERQRAGRHHATHVSGPGHHAG